MTEINIKGTRLTAKGHAGYNLEGPDVVCASVSILGLQLAQTIIFAEDEGKLNEPPHITLESGNIQIECTPKRKYRQEIRQAFEYAETGYLLLQETFPKNVSVGGLPLEK